MRFPKSRTALALFVACATLAATPAPTRKTPPIAAEVLSDRSRMDEDLRILCDEIGGRLTGSMAYGAALEWGLEAFRRAEVDSVALESYDAPALWEGVDAEAAVVSPVRFPLRVVSFAIAPSTSGRAQGAPRRRRNGRESRRSRSSGARPAARSSSSGRSRCSPSKTSSPSTWAAPRCWRPRGGRGRRGDPLRLHAPAGPSLPAPDHVRRDARLDSDGHGFPRGGTAPRAAARARARNRRLALEIKNRIGGPWRPQERGGRDPRNREARRDRAARRAPRLVGPRHRCARQRRQLRARRRGRPGDRRGPPARSGRCASSCSRGRRSASSARAATSPLTATRWTVTWPRSDPRHRGRAHRRVLHDDGRPELHPALSTVLAPVAAWGAAGLNDEAILGHRQLRLPPRRRSEPDRQPGDGEVPGRLPRRVRHVRQGGPRAKRA